MRKTILVIACSVAFLGLSFSYVHSQQVFKTTAASVIGYLEYVPQDYAMNSHKYPVVIFLHGIGERGYNSTDPALIGTTIQKVAKLGPPYYVKNGNHFPFILISPQLKSNFGTWPAWYVMEVINHVKTYLRIDEKRIYLTGLSLGGGGVWVTAQDFPEFFAAIAPVCGGYNSPSKACNIAAENLPVWAFHGDRDTVVPMSKTTNMVNAINACTPKPNPLAKVTIYTGVAHNAWDKAYKIDNSVHNPNLYQWITSFTNTVNKGNKIPLANAGADRIAAPGTVIITGSGSDPDGSIVSYSWSQLAGPSAAGLANNLTNALTASNLREGAYTFRLTVKDNSGNTDSDYVTLTVSSTAAAPENTLPVANAGPNKTIYLPTNSITVTGTGTDSDGTIVAYSWTKVSGPSAMLSGTSAPTLSVTNMVEGTYVFRLTVTDDRGGKKSDDMGVGVKAPNAVPVANAGPDKTITLPVNYVTLAGTGSDSDGTIAAYAWTKVSGPSASLAGTSTPALSVTNMLEGGYVFRLTVTDNKGAKKSDDVGVTVKPATTTSNVAPLANAGPNKILYWPTSAVTISGSGSDSDGIIASYSWKQIKGAAVTMTGTTSSTLSVSKLAIGAYVFRLTVTDNKGATHFDDMLVSVKDPLALAAPAGEARFRPGENEAVLDDLTLSDLKGATVKVFTAEGEQIFSGVWKAGSFDKVFDEEGLYIYNVVRDGVRTGYGKILISQREG